MHFISHIFSLIEKKIYTQGTIYLPLIKRNFLLRQYFIINMIKLQVVKTKGRKSQSFVKMTRNDESLPETYWF